MTTKRTVVTAISVVIVALLGVYFTDGILWYSGKGITKENFDKIDVGMTLEQVEEIFGCPPEWRLEAPSRDGEATWNGEAAWIAVWNGSGVQASLDFSDEDVLVDRQWGEGVGIGK